MAAKANMKTDNVNRLKNPLLLIQEKKISRKIIKTPAGGHFYYRCKAENLIRSSTYLWLPSH